MAGAAFSIVMLLWLLMMVVGAALYFLPTIVAVARHRSNVAVIAVINVLLGWSFIGWVVALVMALSQEAAPQIIHVHQQMGYMPGYQQPAPPYPQPRYQPGSQIQPVDVPPAPGSQLASQNDQPAQ